MRRLLIFLGIFFLMTGCGFRTIEDGETGVKVTLGKIADQPLATGLHVYMPVISYIEKWNVKTQEVKEMAAVPSSEGLISSLDVSIIYNVPKHEVVKVRKTIGRNYMQIVLEPYIREAIRNVVSGYEVKALYSDEGRTQIGQNILLFLKAKLDPLGVIVQDILLRDVRLPASFAQSIENKLRAEQESLQKEFELQKAKKDAEIEVAKAEGVAKSNQIIAGSITDYYLRYKLIEGLQSNQKMVVYVPTEANLPILEAGRMGMLESGSREAREKR